MPEVKPSEGQEILSILRRLEGAIFAERIAPISRMAAECSCQNCECYTRSGGSCGCNPNCTCQGRTANHPDPEMALDSVLGVAAVLPIEDVKSLVALRDKAAQSVAASLKKRLTSKT